MLFYAALLFAISLIALLTAWVGGASGIPWVAVVVGAGAAVLGAASVAGSYRLSR